MSVIEILSNIRNYNVRFSKTLGFLNFHERFKSICYIVDENVWNIYGGTALKTLPRDCTIIINSNEEKKRLETVQEIYDRLIDRSAKRNLAMIAIGGGILQDITGFVASTLYRGINWILVPTTLLAQADSCIGSKTSLNYKRYKNLIGTFYPPSEVYIYSPFLATLPELDFLSGLGEVVKLYMMGGKEKTEEIRQMMPSIKMRDITTLEECTLTSLFIKKRYMEEDEFDIGRRNLLNFGHTFGHAIESVSDYFIPHGQAVVIGIIFSNIVARNRGLLSSENFNRHLETLLLTLSIRPRPNDLNEEANIEVMKKDKKKIGENFSIVMLKNDYTLVKVDDFKSEEMCQTIRELKEIVL